MKPEIKSFSRYEELRSPSKTAQKLLIRHLSRTRVILKVIMSPEEEQTSGFQLLDLLESVKGGFLFERLAALGVATLIDLRHIAGLTTLWEYRDLLSIGMGFHHFGRNWAFFQIMLSRLRKEELETMGNITTAAILKHGMYRDKYRALNDALWKPEKVKKPKLVDLDSDSDIAAPPVPAPDTPKSSIAPKEVVPREVVLARAANLLNLPRFR